ncbi:uncharacterized protein LOC125238847 [Leguminivora glycinivorella]|uniref:uncharacterized protein LOC125238847 n=1 Tax=Leguminivora glycinivorella TaxID=1035111 RepID=UPI00200F06DF|nr:uncharacterized protein LOC125238847 [Leguminivora glycinivorella]
MASKVVFACVVFAIFDASKAQVIKNLLPGCGCGSNVDVIQNQVLLNQPGLVAGGLCQPGLVGPGLVGPGLVGPGLVGPGLVGSNVVAGNVIPGFGGVIGPCNGLATNIIQDNTVANNLANTLQLLLVSNLLSNTLPNTPDLLTVPAVSPYATGLSYFC